MELNCLVASGKAFHSLIGIVKSDLGPNLFAKVYPNFLPVKSLNQTAWVQITPNNCQARSGSKLFAKVHPNFLSVTSLCQTA